MNEGITDTNEMPPEVHLVGPLVCKIVLLAAASAGGLALFFSRFGGCDWMGSVWRTAVAATVVAFLGGLFAGPLQRAITPTVKKEFTPEGQALAQNPAQASKQP